MLSLIFLYTNIRSGLPVISSKTEASTSSVSEGSAASEEASAAESDVSSSSTSLGSDISVKLTTSVMPQNALVITFTCSAVRPVPFTV